MYKNTYIYIYNIYINSVYLKRKSPILLGKKKKSTVSYQPKQTMTGPHCGRQCRGEIILILWTAFPLTLTFMLYYEVEEQ